MTPNEIVARLAHLGAERAKLDHEWQTLKYDLEDRAKAEFRAIPGLRAFVSVTWKDTMLYIESLNQVQIMEGGGWGKTDPTDEHGYGLPLEKGPMPWADFESRMKLLSETLGLEVNYCTLKRRTEGGIENVAALRALYPGKTVTLIAKGTVMYVGWDIGDDWYEATIGDEKWAFWGVGAHGGGIVCSAQLGTPEWTSYEAFRASGS